MSVPLHQLGALGIAKDTPFHELPLNVWSDGENVRFYDGMVESFLGETSLKTTTQALRHLAFVKTPTVTAIVGLSLTDAYAYTGAGAATETEITRAASDYAATDTNPWVSTFLTGIPIFNQYVDIPQMWTPVSIAQRLQNLTNWNANHRAKVVRAFGSFLVALYISKTGTEYPYMVKWSSPADPGAVPASWDEADPTTLAGESELAETQGFLVDCLPLGDQNIIYKQDSVYTMTFVGGQSIFKFRKLFDDFGVFGPNCVAAFEGKHAVLTVDDFVVHNGVSFTPVLSRSWRRELFGRLDATNRHHTFVFANAPKKEVWICYPRSGNTWCTEALVWNWKEGTVGIRELVDNSFIVLADLTTDDTWASDSQAWDDDPSLWDAALVNISNLVPHGAKPTSTTQLRKMEFGNTLNGTAKTSKVERQGWAIDGGKTIKGEPRVDLGSVKQLTGIRPKFESSDYTKLKFYIGSQMFIDGPVTWSGPLTLNQATGFKLDYTVAARLLALRVESTEDVFWRLWGMDVELAKAAEF